MASENMPDSWRTAIICTIYKKGDKLPCSNYRGISLLYVRYSVLTNILHRRLVPYAEKNLGECECGVRRGRSTTENLFMLTFRHRASSI